jgi:glycosyltransferase 2 family protein
MFNWLASNRRLLLRLAGTILATGLIFVLMREEGWNEVVQALRQISWSTIASALVLVILSRLFVATRWYILLRSGDVKISVPDAAALTFTGLFSNNFLPTTIGGDVIRLAGAMRLGYDRAVCLASLAADRLVGMLGMFFTLPLGLLPALGALGQGAIQAATLAGLVSRALDFIRRTLRTFSIWFSRPYALLAALGCTWGHMLCTFLTMYILIAALGAHVEFWLIAGLWSLAYFVTLVPISINGYGVQELSLTFLFSKVAGLTTATSLTVAVLIRALYIAVSLVGAFYLPGILASVDRREPSDRPMD